MKFPHLQEITKSYNHSVPYASEDSDDQDGTGIDLAGVTECRSGLVLCAAGAPTGSPSSFSIVFTLEESDDNSTFTAVSGKTATLDASGEIQEIAFDPSQLKRYVRLNRDVTISGGSSPTVPSVGLILLGAPKRGPLS